MKNAFLAFLLLAPVNAQAASILEIEPNNTTATAQSLDGFFDLTYDPEVVFSSVLPHVTVRGSGDDTIDIYSFTLLNYSDVYIDIDHTSINFDSFVSLYNSQGTYFASNENIIFGDPGSDTGFDSFLEGIQLLPGTYFIEVYRSDVPGPVVPLGESYTMHVSADNTPVTTSVPEPSTLSLAFMSLSVAVGSRCWRRRHNKPEAIGKD